MNISNPKIAKINASIDKIKAKIAELSAKQRELEKRKTKLEDEEIVARFRREKTNEDGYSALGKSSPMDVFKNDTERNHADDE